MATHRTFCGVSYRSIDFAGSTYLANIDVGTVAVDVGIVRPQHGSVETVGRHDTVTDIVRLNNVGRLAVIAGGTKAEVLNLFQQSIARKEVSILTWPIARLVQPELMAGFKTAS